MKFKALLIAILSFAYVNSHAQITLKTEYLGKSSYWLEKKNKDPREKVGDAEGSAMVYSGSVNIPLSVKTNADQKPIIWGLGMSGSYVKLKNENFTEDLVIDEIVNADIGFYHKRPISKRWTLMASAGAGLYTATTDLSQIRGKNILGSVSTLFIYRMRPNLEIGAGVAVNSTFGYPMAFPALYVNWTMQGKLDFKLNMSNGLNVAAGYHVNKFLKMSVIGEMNGQMALLEKDNKDVMFSHLYIVTGLRAEVKLGKRVSIPITGGINAVRPTTFSDRTLQGMFKSKDSYYFQTSPYFATGLNIKI
ncbi:DUF6268 family outer membrane beta-barrel protein [Sphingobacterium sp. Mn56C]|uniref:DUF6268 family outer membrane beta-barrel protein n=1 Tax=Sphingobacterium sp. Mn56C TaxID=3395261 RepID=UPI003BBB0951